VLILKEEGRSEFKKPFGKLYPSIKDLKDNLEKYKRENNLIISIGDVTTINLQKEGIKPDMGIIDNKIERKESEFKNKLVNYNVQLKAENPPGTITRNLWNTIKKGFHLIETSQNNILIIVNGEEDLAVIPCVIMAPSNSIILYGQPGEGVVVCEVDKVKSEAEKLLEKFEETENGN
jgi:hypothetical protein